MAKPRIIIADTDAGYIFPLQLKFAEEFFDKVDIEIITDQEYFDKLFSVPQQAAILIVSEDLYDRSLQRHTISNTFLMMEQAEEESTADLNIRRLYKYTSIKEIFSEIVGKSSDALNIAKSQKKEPQIVLFTSANGGVGKTTLALGASICLTRSYKRVLYINADRLQTFQHLLENPTAISAADVYAKLSNTSANGYNEVKHVIRKEAFSYLPAFKASLMSVGLQYEVFERIAKAAKQSGDYDFVVVDSDVTFDEHKADMLSIADKVVVVTKQNRASVFATNLFVSNITGVHPEKYFFVCNDFDKELDNALIAPSMTLQFSINEYVEHFGHYDQMKCADLARDKGIQKTAFLIM